MGSGRGRSCGWGQGGRPSWLSQELSTGDTRETWMAIPGPPAGSGTLDRLSALRLCLPIRDAGSKGHPSRGCGGKCGEKNAGRALSPLFLPGTTCSHQDTPSPTPQLRPLSSCVTFVSRTASPHRPCHTQMRPAVALATAPAAAALLASGGCRGSSLFHPAREGKRGLRLLGPCGFHDWLWGWQLPEALYPAH